MASHTLASIVSAYKHDTRFTTRARNKTNVNNYTINEKYLLSLCLKKNFILNLKKEKNLQLAI